MTEGIVQEVFELYRYSNERFGDSNYNCLEQKLIEAIRQTLDYKADNENTVTYYILKLLIGDTK